MGGGTAPTIDVSLASKGQMMPDKKRMFAVIQPIRESDGVVDEGP